MFGTTFDRGEPHHHTILAPHCDIAMSPFAIAFFCGLSAELIPVTCVTSAHFPTSRPRSMARVLRLMRIFSLQSLLPSHPRPYLRCLPNRSNGRCLDIG